MRFSFGKILSFTDPKPLFSRKFQPNQMAFCFWLIAINMEIKKMKFDKKLAPQIGRWCIALWIWGDFPLLFTTCVIFPTSTLRSGASSKSCIVNAVRGYTE